VRNEKGFRGRKKEHHLIAVTRENGEGGVRERSGES